MKWKVGGERARSSQSRIHTQVLEVFLPLSKTDPMHYPSLRREHTIIKNYFVKKCKQTTPWDKPRLLAPEMNTIWFQPYHLNTWMAWPHWDKNTDLIQNSGDHQKWQTMTPNAYQHSAWWRWWSYSVCHGLLLPLLTIKDDNLQHYLAWPVLCHSEHPGLQTAAPWRCQVEWGYCGVSGCTHSQLPVLGPLLQWSTRIN